MLAQEVGKGGGLPRTFSSGHVRLFETPWTAGCKASPSITNSWSLLKLMSIDLVMPPNHLTFCCPLLILPLIFPNIRDFFLMNWLFAAGGQSTGASVSSSVLPMNIQDWFLLGLTSLISLQSKGLKEFLPTPQFKSISSLAE